MSMTSNVALAVLAVSFEVLCLDFCCKNKTKTLENDVLSSAKKETVYFSSYSFYHREVKKKTGKCV